MSIYQTSLHLFECLWKVNNPYVNEFKAQKTNLQRVDFVYKVLERHNLFFKFSSDCKDDVEATKWRNEGNKHFAAGKYLEAVTKYTTSIQMAKSPEVLALAYGNRSACFLKLNMHKECIIEIDRALANNYPKEKKIKLIERRKQAVKLEKATKQNFENLPDTIPQCVKIEKNEEFGRHVVATRDIQIGEVLYVEKPDACVLRTDQLTHCHECMEVCYNPIPCENCTVALYCGDNCKLEALKKYHKYECSLLKTLDEHGLNQVLLSLKMTFLAIQNDSNKYKEIDNLITNMEHRPVRDVFIKALVAATTFNLVKNYTECFTDQDDTLKQKFKEILLLQILIVDMNSISIYEISPDEDNHWFATGLYTFSSLFNHSCCYNVVRFGHGSTLVFRAYNTIKQGEQCFISYGFEYVRTPTHLRQPNIYMKYYFHCRCRACEEDWSPREKLPVNIPLMMEPEECLLTADLIFNGDVNVARRILPKIITALKKCEHMEPLGYAPVLKNLLFACYRTLGNKRRF